MNNLRKIITGLSLSVVVMSATARESESFRVILESTNPIVSETSEESTYSTSGIFASSVSLSNSEAGTYRNHGDIAANVVPTSVTSISLSVNEPDGDTDGAVTYGDSITLTADAVGGTSNLSWEYSTDGTTYEGLPEATGVVEHVLKGVTEESIGYYRATAPGAGEAVVSDAYQLVSVESPSILPPAGLAGSKVVNLDTNEYQSEWFGQFEAMPPVEAEGDSLINTVDHGVLQVSSMSDAPGELWFYDFGIQAWVYTSESVYPNLYIGGASWAYYPVDIFPEGIRWVYLYGEEEPWLEAPLFEF